jgi:hypothetical protein
MRPKVKLTGKDGNVFNLLELCVKALKKAGQDEAARELQSRVFASKSYSDSLAIMAEYVDIR